MNFEVIENYDLHKKGNNVLHIQLPIYFLKLKKLEANLKHQFYGLLL